MKVRDVRLKIVMMGSEGRMGNGGSEGWGRGEERKAGESEGGRK